MCSMCDFQSYGRLVEHLRCKDTDFFLFVKTVLTFDHFGMKMKGSANAGLYAAGREELCCGTMYDIYSVLCPAGAGGSSTPSDDWKISVADSDLNLNFLHI